MALSDFHFRKDYESLRDDIVSEFYVPALSETVLYQRAVGYFTSRSFELVFQGIEKLLLRDGKIQLITSPELDPADMEEIRDGYSLKNLVEKKLDLAISDMLERGDFDNLGLLGLLIARGHLEIKVAFTSNGDYLFHSKYGIFEDALGNQLAFNGSNNETERAIRKNSESFEAYCSWVPQDAERVKIHAAKFEKLWNNSFEHCDVIDFPAVSRDRLISLSAKWREKYQTSQEAVNEDLKKWALSDSLRFKIPPNITIRHYQQEAVEQWWRASHRGIFTMATGTGKTKTALIAAAKVYEKLAKAGSASGLFITVVVPYESLVSQWSQDILEFGVPAIQARGASSTWSQALATQIHELNIGVRNICIVVVTNSSFARKKFQAFLETVQAPFLIIADEVHNLGAKSYLSALPEKANLRLGLSATPERLGDEEGNTGLQEYFGEEVYEYSMEQAIRNGYLTTYRYFPRVVELSDMEADRYAELTTKIDRMFAQSKGMANENSDFPDHPALKNLLIERSRLIAHASAKVEAFKADIRNNRDRFYQLIYCAEGSDPLNRMSAKQTGVVLEILTEELGIRAAEYTSETSSKERSIVLRDFAEGAWIQALVSMRCLDEGVDIPNARIGYILASTTNYRQAVQRRGRLLRLADGKDEAIIYDYLVVPSEKHHDRRIGRRLLRNELARGEEFRRLAINSHEAASIINPLKIKYGLFDR